MRKIIASVLLAVIAASAFGQDLLKYNYKRNDFVYTGAERVEVASAPALQLKLGRITYPDGGKIYTLRIDFESASAWKMPRNASLIFNLSDGKSLMLNNAKDEANLVAPKGVLKGGRKVWYNYGEYYLEQADLDRLLGGVADLDATRRMTADGHVKVSFKANEFSKALAVAYDAITIAKSPVIIADELAGINDYSGNRMVTTKPVRVGQGVSVSLTYLYSAENNSESYDLNLKFDAGAVTGGSAMTFTAPSGAVIHLRQEKDLPAGEAVCYPDFQQLKALMRGVGRIEFETQSGPQTAVVASSDFGKAVTVLYNAIQRVAIL